MAPIIKLIIGTVLQKLMLSTSIKQLDPIPRKCSLLSYPEIEAVKQRAFELNQNFQGSISPARSAVH